MNNDAQPILISQDDTEMPLPRVSLAAGGESSYDEAWLQDLVFRHPNCLPIQELDAAYQPLVPLCREMRTPAGPVDVVYATPSGRLVVLEAKLWRNPEARRKVVGQILDYAKELKRWSYDELQREVNIRRDDVEAENVPFEIVRQSYPDTDESAFVDGIEKSLSSGRFLLLVVGDGIREGVTGIADYLTQATSLDFTFGLVELAIHQACDGARLVIPRVVARTVTVQRSVVQLVDGELQVVESEEDVEDTISGGSEVRKASHAFWCEFAKRLDLDDKSQPLPTPRRAGYVTLGMPPSGGLAWLCVYRYTKENTAGVFLNFAKGALGQTAYARLKEEAEDLQAELDGPDIIWEPDPERGGLICQKRTYEDVLDPANREDMLAFLTETTNRFVNTFRPRLESIAENL